MRTTIRGRLGAGYHCPGLLRQDDPSNVVLSDVEVVPDQDSMLVFLLLLETG